MINQINIKPKTITLDSIKIMNLNYFMNQSASFQVLICKNTGEAVESHLVEISGDEFNNWGSDDNYIVELILSKLGLEKA